MEKELTPGSKLGEKVLHLSFALTYLGNEILQKMAGWDIIEYQTFMGYLSDFAAPGYLLGLVSGNTANKSKNVQRAVAVSVPISLTLFELWSIGDDVFTFDGYDIPCYFAGTLVAYYGTNLIRSKEKRKEMGNLLQKINPLRLFKSKNKLEDIIQEAPNSI